MPCYSPLVGYRSRFTNDSGKRSIVFNRSSGFVDQPVTLPCGQCIGCRIDRSRSWALRCVHESKSHDRNCFITLTYSDDKLPNFESLEKDSLQRFFKRLRKAGFQFRYYACGEYGDSTNRPHYHALLFGIDFSEDRKLHTQTGQGNVLYVSKTLESIWGNGFCTISEFNYQTAAYVARYVMKKQTGRNAIESARYSRVNLGTGETFQVAPEFAVMSLRPGLGADWYSRYKKDAFPSDFLISDGKKHPVPRYYLDKLKKEDLSTHDLIKAKRKKARHDSAYDNTPDRLHVRETVKKSQITNLTRSL